MSQGHPDRSQVLPRPAWAPRPVLTAWALVIGIDLFFNAGVFAPLFEQRREPSLLSDDVLFRRIPVAYAALLLGLGLVAITIDRFAHRNTWAGAIHGGVAGLGFAALGIVYLWTAIDMTGAFVAAGSLVLITEFASAGAVLTAFTRTDDRSRLTRRILLAAGAVAVGGIVIQNLPT